MQFFSSPGNPGSFLPLHSPKLACLVWAWRAPRPQGELLLSKASEPTGCRYELRCIVWKTAQVDLRRSLTTGMSDIYVKG